MSEITPSVQDHLTTARAAYARFVRLAEQADLHAPTRLSGWRVSDLVEHVTWGMGMEAAALSGGVTGQSDATSSDAEPGDLAGALGDFERASGQELAADQTVALPAAAVPLAYAAPLFAFEAALHADDLAHAIGEDSRLSDAEVAACRIVIGPMLDLVAGVTPLSEAGERVVLDLVMQSAEGSGSERMRLSASDQGWRRTAPPDQQAPDQQTHDQQAHDVPATTTITGDERSVILFVTGRLGADALQISGDPVHAERFKQYFPGP